MKRKPHLKIMSYAGFSELLIAMGLVFIMGVISTATSVMTTIQVKRQVLKLDKQEAFYTGELAAWHFYYKNDGSSLPCSSSAGSGGRCIVSITNETGSSGKPPSGQKGNPPPGQNEYHPESYQPGVPLALAITRSFDSNNTILRRYTGDNIKIKNLARTDMVSFCGEMSFTTRTRTFLTCLVSPPEEPKPPLPPVGTGIRNGKTIVNLRTSPVSTSTYDIVHGIALQKDGKIVVVGSANPGGGASHFVMARYLPDGKLDESFGRGGIVTTFMGAWKTFSRSVAIQSDGKIVVSGFGVRSQCFYDAIIVRYLTDGQVDPKFGKSGRTVIDHGHSGCSDSITPLTSGSNETLMSLTIQKDGKILVAGSVVWPDRSNSDFLTIRLHADGNPDNGFGDKGIVITDFGQNGIDKAFAIAVGSDGKIFVGGNSSQKDTHRFDFAIAAYLPDGSLDASFGTGGLVRTVMRSSEYDLNFIFALVVQEDGKVVAAGKKDVGQTAVRFNPPCGVDEDATLVRYLPNGSLDVSFGTNGIVATDIQGNSPDGVLDIKLLKDGKLAVVGYTGMCGGDQKDVYGFLPDANIKSYFLAQYLPSGALDTSFGVNGLVSEGGDRFFHVMDIQSDGQWVVGGTRPHPVDFTLSRFDPTGNLDLSFGNQGYVYTDIGDGNDAAYGVALQPDGKIVVVGNGADKGMALRLTSDGILDKSFGKFGIASYAWDNPLKIPLNYKPHAVVIQGDGKIVSGGYVKDFSLLRYLPDGLFDTSFGKDSFAAINNAYRDGFANDLVIQTDGKFVLAGHTFDKFKLAGHIFNDFKLARFDSQGQLDSGFGSGGVVITDVRSGPEQFTGVAIQKDGKIIAAGFTVMEDPNDEDFTVARYQTDGALDTGFGTNGLVYIDFHPPPVTYEKPEQGVFQQKTSDIAYDVILQEDGKILLVGLRRQPKEILVALARLLSNGALDPSFGKGGKVLTDIGTYIPHANSGLYSIGILPDGRIVVMAPYQSPFAGMEDKIALLCYNANGKPDLSFGQKGIAKLNLTDSYESGGSLKVQPDGRIIVVGNVSSNSNDFLIARINHDGSLDTSFGDLGF